MRYLELKKVAKGDGITVAVEANGYVPSVAPADGVILGVGFKAAFVTWEDLDAFRASKDSAKTFDPREYICHGQG